MIPADLGAELTAGIRAAVDAGELPPAAGQVVPSGTWRAVPALAPPGISAPPGRADGRADPEWTPPYPGDAAAMARRYATSLPFALSRLAGCEAREVAARLAPGLARLPWVSSAGVTGDGYLSIEVSAAALARVAVRISAAGPWCACGGAVGDPALARLPETRLSGTGLSGTGAAGAGPAGTRAGGAGPAPPDLAVAASWRQAGQAQAAAVIARLARAAVTAPPEGSQASGDYPERGPGAGHGRPAAGPVASAVSYAGADAVRYWLTRNPSWPDRGPSSRALATRDLSNAWYAVTFAQADAARTGLWAADLGMAPDEPAPPGERLAGLVGAPAEVVLLGRLSWLGERVAGAARRARPADLARYLEELAAAWLACREVCPALPFGGAAAPREAAGTGARLLLARATATALGAGLSLIGAGPAARSAGRPGVTRQS